MFLIVMLASVVQAATIMFENTDFTRSKESMVFPLNMMAGRHFETSPAGFEFPALFDVRSLTILKGGKVVGACHSGSRMSSYMIDSDILTSGAPKPAGSDSDPRLFRFLDIDLFRLKWPEEPIPAPALLILVGLIALIALKGRRK